MIIPIILAGGKGTRLWPLSRELCPKQLLPLVDRRTLLQNTILRLPQGLSPPIVLCNEEHRFLVAEQLRTIGVKNASIVLEPMGRNTAPAVAISAELGVSLDPESVLLVLPADHHIEDLPSFHQAIVSGEALAHAGHLVTFGILPDCPETGYGYIRKGPPITGGSMDAFEVERFVEKPDRETAEDYVASGDYLWNSGIFMFRTSTILAEIQALAPDIAVACRNALLESSSDLDFHRLNPNAYAACPSDSIDYAVMEKTDKGAVVPLSCGWNDLGCWDAFFKVEHRDAQDNILVGDVLAHDVKQCYIHATSRLVAAIGVENHIIVETPDAVLVSSRDRVQEVKVLVERLKDSQRPEAMTHRKVYRPWGSYEPVASEERFQVKRIVVKPGAKLSMQKHHHRAEHWVVVRGTALITRGSEEVLLKEDESTYIPLGIHHRLDNPGKIDLEIIEVQTGSYLGEDDIVRFEDVYGRSH